MTLISDNDSKFTSTSDTFVKTCLFHTAPFHNFMESANLLESAGITRILLESANPCRTNMCKGATDDEGSFLMQLRHSSNLSGTYHLNF